MGKKAIYSNYRIEVDPAYRYIYAASVNKHSASVADCEEIAREIRRHCDNVNSAVVRFDAEQVCEFCDYKWEEGEPACCDKAIAEWGAAQSAKEPKPLTPLDTNSILRILAKANSACSTGTHDWFGKESLGEFADDGGAHIAACDPTTISALCRANLRLVAMERALFSQVECTEAERIHALSLDMASALENGKQI